MAKLKLILTTRPIWLLVVVGITALAIGLLIPTAPGFRGPLLTVENTVLAAVILAIGAFTVNLYSDRGQLYQRLGKVEEDLKAFKAENDTLRGDLAAAASFINRIGIFARQWLTDGIPPARWPQPPTQILDHGVDGELWDVDDAPGGTD